MYPVTPTRQTRVSFFPMTARTSIKLLVACLVIAAVPVALYVRVDSKSSQAALTVQAVGRGGPYFNLQDGHEMRVEYRGDQNLTAAMQSGQARPRSLAAMDLNGDAAPDLVAGYSYGGLGIVTIQRGNADAFAPKDDGVFTRMQQGYNPDSLMPLAETYLIPEPADFLQLGDFNHDSRKDILVAANGGDLFLLAGDGNGGLGSPEQIALPGQVTALNSGEFKAADGSPDVAVSVSGPKGSALLIYDGAGGGFSAEPVSYQLAAPASAIQFADLDNDPFSDVAVASGSQIKIVHGWGRKQEVDPQSQVENIDAAANVRGLALGYFLWNRAAAKQIGLLGDDGTLQLLQRGTLDTRPYTAEDIAARAKLRMQQKKSTVDVETVRGWQAGGTENWTTAREVASGSVPTSGVASQGLMTRSHISFRETDDLLVLGGNERKLNIMRQVGSQDGAQAEAITRSADLAEVNLDVTDAPVAVLALPQKLNGERSLVVLQAGSTQPTIVPQAPTAVITVDRADDTAAASACTAAANDCSLRGAVAFANVLANAGSTINLPNPNTLPVPATAYSLTINGTGGCLQGAETNSIGDLEINQSTTITGAGAATTIIRQLGVGNGAPNFTGDRVMCLNVPFTVSLIYNFSGITITGGRDTAGLNGGTFGGGGIIGGEKDNQLNLTNVVISNNQNTGPGLGGGGIQITGGSMTIVGSTIGGTNDPGAIRSDVTLGNSVGVSGGGISYSPGSPTGKLPSAGTLTITGSTFSHNFASSIAAGGGGADLYTHNLGTGSVSVGTSTFNNNQANGAPNAGSGGAINIESIGTTVATTAFTSNTATNLGGGIYVGGGSLLLDGTGPTITFTSNTATNGGSSVGANSTVNVSGTNTTIGGSVAVFTNGTWTNNAGSTLSPTDFSVLGGTLTCNNSTMNVSGNFTLGHEATKGGIFNGNTGTINIQGNLNVDLNNGGSGAVGQFNGGTGLFNFNGSVAQAINGPSSPTFGNLTINKTGTLTLNVSSPVAGNLTVSSGTFDLLGNTANRTAAGGTLTVSNGALLKIGGTGTLPSNFSTHSIGATSTIEYAGTNQTVATLNSAQKYGNLIISGSGTKTLQGAISVATLLTINGGTLDASASNFNIDDAGSWTNNVAAANFNPRAATVTFSSGVQNINGLAAAQTFNNLIMNDTSLTVGGSTTTLNLNGNLTLTAGIFSAGSAANINVGGNWTNNIGAAGFVPGTGTVTFNSSTGAQAINGTAASQTFNNLTVSKTGQTFSTGGSTTQLDLNGNFNLTAGTVTAPATINVAGDWTAASGTIFTPGAGTVTFNGSGARNINGTATNQAFNNLVINKSGGGSVTNSGSATTYTVSGGVTLTQGTFAPSAVSIGIAGNWTNNGGTLTPGTSTVVFNSGAAPQSITGTAVTQTFNNISVLKSAQSLNVAGSTTTLNLNGTMNIASGNFNVNTAASVTVGGNWTLDNTATFTAGGGTNTVTFNGIGAQSLNGTSTTETFNNLTVSKTAGTLSVAGSLATLTIGKDFSITQGTFAGGTATINVAGNWSNLGTFTGNTSTVVFNGNAIGQTISGNTTFNNLTINHSGAGNVDASGSTLAVGGLLRIQQGTFISSSQFNNVQIDAGNTLQGSNATTMSVSGNWTNNGGTFTPNGNIVNFNGAGAQTIGGTSASQSFNNFTVNKAGGTLTVGGSTTSLTIAGGVTLTAGTFAAGTATPINVAGNWTNNGGTFTGGTGTVVFNGGAGQTIGGTTASTFNNLTNGNASGLGMANNDTVSGVLALGSTDITVAAGMTLTQPVGGSSTGTSDVNGRVQRTGFVTGGGALSFGNPLNTIQVTAGVAPANIVVDLTRSVPTGGQGFPTAVQRTYTITPSAAGFTGTLRLHYLDSELNGNTEGAGLNLWRFNGTGWSPNPITAFDTTANWVEKTGITTFSPWTMNSTNAPTASGGVVTGRIVDGSGNGVEGAVVRLSGTQNRKFITDANGVYRFDNVETSGFYTVTPSRANYSFSPAARSFSQLGQATEAAFGATLASSGFVNPLDTPEYFVRQHYLDFLGREPDEAGFNFWSDQIIECGTDNQCSEGHRVNVSAAYFFSIEFQQTGGLVDGLYRVGYGVRPEFGAFMPDTRAVGLGVVVGRDGWQAKLEANKQAFVEAFVNRAAFRAAYDGLSSSDYVDALISHTGVSFTSGEREAWVSNLTTGGASRAEVLRSIAENQRFVNAKLNDAFVMMEYFGYLRRDADADGFAFWLNKLNQFGGNFEQAEMVKAFIVSGEYRDRFPR